MGDMPPEHEAHKAPRPGDLVVILHPSTGWGVTAVPYAYLSPMQERGMHFDRERGFWCAPLP
jgi:hypothetical protein